MFTLPRRADGLAEAVRVEERGLQRSEPARELQGGRKLPSRTAAASGGAALVDDTRSSPECLPSIGKLRNSVRAIMRVEASGVQARRSSGECARVENSVGKRRSVWRRHGRSMPSSSVQPCARLHEGAAPMLRQGCVHLRIMRTSQS